MLAALGKKTDLCGETVKLTPVFTPNCQLQRSKLAPACHQTSLKRIDESLINAEGSALFSLRAQGAGERWLIAGEQLDRMRPALQLISRVNC